ncbi:hypothetical protein ACV338_30565, partial [Pseudomonas aeruginosa]
DIPIRHREHGPRLPHITSSAIKPEFPRRLLEWFDRLNRWLYAPWSPLNWLTQRRSLEIRPRVPQHSQAGEPSALTCNTARGRPSSPMNTWPIPALFHRRSPAT